MPRAFCPQCLADLATTRERASLRSAEDIRRFARMQGELSVFDKAIEARDLARDDPAAVRTLAWALEGADR